jgi:hypothetical protein
MKQLFSLLFSSYLLALCATVIIFLFFPLNINKYLAELTNSGSYLNDQVVWYDDLNTDGTHERITIFHNSLNEASLTVSNNAGVINQWNFHGRFDLVQLEGIVITGDRDNDKIRELYVFTLSHDSVLLHCIDDYRKPSEILRNRFITRVGNRNKKMDPFIIPAQMDDLTHDGYPELIFGVGTGYSLFPRRIIAFDMYRDTLLSSPESGYFINEILQADITGDGINELLPYGYAAANTSDSLTAYSDQNSWLMALNQRLEFVFDPVKFPGIYSNLIPAVIKDNKKVPQLIALYIPPEKHGNSNQLISFSAEGKIVNKVSVPFWSKDIIKLTDKKGKDWILLLQQGSGFDRYDASLSRHGSARTEGMSIAKAMDIDGDGLEELIVKDIYKRQFIIHRNNLKHPVTMTFNGSGERGAIFSVKRNTGSTAEIYIQLGTEFCLYKYSKNPAYAFRFAFYALAYMGFLIFALLVARIQQEQIRKKAEIRKRITGLQLQIVSNQLDPHFVMNAVNSIIACISEKEKEEARQQLLQFSKLHRSLLLSSEQVERCLKDEIDFTENYLALEKFRFSNRFAFNIEIDPAVDLQLMIPKMILQIHVENALKHGILPLEKDGMIKIRITHVL